MSNGRAAVAVITSLCPLPADDGNRQRQLNLVLGLAEEYELTLFTPEGVPGILDGLASNGVNVVSVPQTKRVGIAPLRRLTPFANLNPEAMVPPEIRVLRAKIAEHAATRDSPFEVVVAPLSVASAAEAAGASRLIVDEQNFEATRYQRLLDSEPNKLRRIARKHDQLTISKFERRWLTKADAVTACSQADSELIESEIAGATPVYTVPNGADTASITFTPRQPDSKNIVFVGGMSYTPNVLAAQTLVKEVMPLVWAKRPDLKVQIVGKTPAPEVRALASERVEVTGMVDSTAPYLAGAALTAVPINVAGGTRLKLLEAMAAGVPIVASGVAAEGLDLDWGREALSGNTPEEMSAAILELLDKPETAVSIAQAARKRVEADFAWTAIRKKLVAVVEDVRQA